jgi:hypothetical protein
MGLTCNPGWRRKEEKKNRRRLGSRKVYIVVEINRRAPMICCQLESEQKIKQPASLIDE